MSSPTTQSQVMFETNWDFYMPGAVSKGDPIPGQCSGRVHRDGDPSRNCVRREHGFAGECEDVEGYTEWN